MLTKIRHFIGFIFLVIGMCSADSENLIYPILILAFGILMIEDLIGKDIKDTPYSDK